MALPRSLTSLGANVGPFFSSDGAAYYITYGGLEVQAHKSADPSSTAFSEVDAANNPTTSTIIRGNASGGPASVDAYPVGDVIHVAIFSVTIPAMGDWEFYWDYCSFDMSSDAWDTSTIDSSVNDTAFAVNGSDVTTGEIRIMVRGNDGDIVIVGGGTADTAKGTDYSTIYHAFFNGSTWSTPTRIDTATSEVNYRFPNLSADYQTDGDYAVTHNDVSAGTVHGRAVTGASHTHESDGTVGTTGFNGQDLLVYNDGGTYRGSAVIFTSSAADAFRFDPTSATPFASETAESDITGADVPRSPGNGAYQWLLQAYDPATDTRYAIYVVDGTPDSITYVSSVNEATWGSATTHSSPANDTRIPWGHATVGTSPSDGSSTVIGFLYLDNTAGTAYYDEIVISGGGTTVQKTVSLDAAIRATLTKQTSLDAAVQQQGITKTADLDAVVQAVFAKAASIDAAVLATLTQVANLDAAVQQLGNIKTLGLDGVVSLIVQLTAALDAAILEQDIQKVASLDAVLQQVFMKTVGVDAAVVSTVQKLVSLEAAIRDTLTEAVSLDAAVLDTLVTTLGLDASITNTISLSAALDAVVSAIFTRAVGLDAAVFATLAQTVSLDAGVQDRFTKITDLDAAVLATLTKTTDLDAAIQDTFAQTLGLDAGVQDTFTDSTDLDAAILAVLTKTTGLDSAVLDTLAKTVSLDASISAGSGTFTKLVSMDAAIQDTTALTMLLSAAIQQAFTKQISLDAAILATLTRTLSLDAAVQQLGIIRTVAVDAAIQDTFSLTTDLDAALSIQAFKNVAFTAALADLGRMKAVGLDANIQQFLYVYPLVSSVAVIPGRLTGTSVTPDRQTSLDVSPDLDTDVEVS